MFANHYQEHLASQPDNTRFDGFDRGTSWDSLAEMTPTERVIGRMTSESGHRVVIKEVQFNEGDAEYSVYINNSRVFCDIDCRPQAIQVARWWMAGCPA
jgi:hypothetical protein